MRSILVTGSVLVALCLPFNQASAAHVRVTMTLEPVQVVEPDGGLAIRCPAFSTTIFEGDVTGTIEIIRPVHLEVLALPALGNPTVSAGVRFTLRLEGVSQSLSSGGACFTTSDYGFFLTLGPANGFACDPGPIKNVQIPESGFAVNFDCRLDVEANRARLLLPIIQFLLDD
ncbi:MAG: hypothetical protein ACR2RL_03905 [Gammaproteobacteria bacterium]